MHKVQLAGEVDWKDADIAHLRVLVPGQLTQDQQRVLAAMHGRRCLVSVTVLQVSEEDPDQEPDEWPKGSHFTLPVPTESTHPVTHPVDTANSGADAPVGTREKGTP